MNASLSSMIVPAVLWALILFSVLSWALLLIKSAQYVRQKSQNKQFTKAFWSAPDLLTAAEHSAQYPGALARIANSGFEAMAVDESPALRNNWRTRSTVRTAWSATCASRYKKSAAHWKVVRQFSPVSVAPRPSSACSVRSGGSWKHCKASV